MRYKIRAVKRDVIAVLRKVATMHAALARSIALTCMHAPPVRGMGFYLLDPIDKITEQIHANAPIQINRDNIIRSFAVAAAAFELVRAARRLRAESHVMQLWA